MSMQIVEKSGEGLSKVFSVTVPMSDLVERLDAKIAEITPTLNIKGFRPGKVPQAHVRKLYGKSNIERQHGKLLYPVELHFLYERLHMDLW